MSTFTYLLAAMAMVAVLSSRAECRPQTPETREVEPVDDDKTQGPETMPLPLWLSQHGQIIGEIHVYTEDISVTKQQKKKQKNGPSVSALVSGPAEVSVGVSGPEEASFGVSPGLTLVNSQAKVEIASAR